MAHTNTTPEAKKQGKSHSPAGTPEGLTREQLKADSAAVKMLVSQAAAKSFRLYHCVPLTGASTELWMVHRGSAMRFFRSLEEMQTGIETLEEYKPHNPAALAEEASLRAALSGDPRSLMTVSDGMHRRGSCDANFASAGREGGAA